MRPRPTFGITFTWILLAAGSLPVARAAEARSRPNVLFIFTDDQRADTIHALGNPHIRTPVLDRLVAEGTTFANAYIMGGSSPAVCSPSRACLMTGRTLWNLENQGEYGFEMSGRDRTLPQCFREDGYLTFATGKNEPGQRGAFARSFSAGDKILFKGMTRSQFSLPLYDFSPTGSYADKPVIHEGKHSAEVYADACIEFLKTRTKTSDPFFAYVAFQTPHDPRQAPLEFRALYKDAEMPLPEPFLPKHPFDNGMLTIRDEKTAPIPRTPQIVRKHLADYYAMVTHTDAQIGRILKALEDTGLRERTLIVFASDNGLAMGSHGLMGKQNVYEHSVRVPLILAGPGIPRGERRDQLCYLYDIYPTLCERAHVKTPASVEFRSLNPVIQDKSAEHRSHLSFAFMSWQRAVRGGRHKLIEYCVNGTRHTQLFDLQKDPSETNDLSAAPEHAETIARLRKLLLEEREWLNDGNTHPPFTNAQGRSFWATYDASMR